MKMQVRTTQRSPFGQKVITAAKILGITEQLNVVDTNFRSPDDPIRVENPLGKMPVLTTEEGQYIYDSRVIVEYLNDRFNGQLIPKDPAEKSKIKTIEALADGICDAGVLIVVEHIFREGEFVSQEWLDHQYGKMIRGFQKLEELDVDPTNLNVGTISIGCLLRWLKKREIYEHKDKQEYFDNWLEKFESLVDSL